MGFKIYVLEFDAEIEFTEECKWVTGLFGQQLSFRTTKPPVQDSGALAQFMEASMNPGDVVKKGQRAQLSGTIRFAKEERGWAVDGLELSRAKLMGGSDAPAPQKRNASEQRTTEGPTKANETRALPLIPGPVVVQPGPADGKDIWTTSWNSYAPCAGAGTGGGADDERLRVGGWGDWYYSLLEFDLTGLPTNATSAVLYLYCFNLSGGGTPMYLDRIIEAWDWRVQGTGCDRQRLWWADKPSTSQWLAGQLATPALGRWYGVDITELYNAWRKGTYQNYGLQFRPVLNSDNNFDEFYSADYMGEPALRPKLVITSGK